MTNFYPLNRKTFQNYEDIRQRSQPNSKIQIFYQNEKSLLGRLEIIKEID